LGGRLSLGAAAETGVSQSRQIRDDDLRQITELGHNDDAETGRRDPEKARRSGTVWCFTET